MADALHLSLDETKAALDKYSLSPLQPKAMRFATKDTFPSPDSCIVGRFVHFDPDRGAQTYDRSRECGVLVLAVVAGDDIVWLRIPLDKQQLADAVYWAVVSLRHHCEVYDVKPVNCGLIVRYIGEEQAQSGKSYKAYRVTPVVPNAAD